MKRLLSLLLATVLLVGCMFSLIACGNVGPKPELDLDTAAENLEDEDYEVEVIDDADELEELEDSAMCGVEEYLTAYKRVEKKNGEYKYLRLQIIVFEDSKTAKKYFEFIKLRYDMQVYELEQEIEELKDEIKDIEKEIEYVESQMEFMQYLMDEFDVDYDDEYEELEEEIDELKEEIEEIEEEIEEIKEELDNPEEGFGRKGNIVWMGSIEAIEDSLG